MTDEAPDPAAVTRRRFLLGAAGTAGVAGVVGAAGLGLSGRSTDRRPAATASAFEPTFHPFRGEHQAGVTTPVPATGLLASLDVVGEGKDALAGTLRDLSEEIEHLMGGKPYRALDPALPPPDPGTMGPTPAPADLSVVVGVGALLFDGRFGLAAHQPRELVTMTKLANDRLDPARCHGDLLLSITADTPDATIFALRQLLRRTRSTLVLRWTVEGFNRRSETKAGEAPVRNLLGFKDGTANLPTDDATSMDRHVWVAAGDDEPAWAAGGSYQVVRIIRMIVEFWDRTSLTEQQQLIGRRKDTGAPLDGTHETDVPDYAADPTGATTPLDAHIRLANPRTEATDENLILRRGLSYSRGFDSAGRLDQGLAFVSFQRSFEKGFLAVQTRLAGEPLEEYVRTEGGGYFFALPGVPEGSTAYLGQGLIEA